MSGMGAEAGKKEVFTNNTEYIYLLKHLNSLASQLSLLNPVTASQNLLVVTISGKMYKRSL